VRGTEIAAAALAKREAASNGLPSANPSASAPLKTSPAPVVSTALTLNAGISCRMSSPTTNAPRAPIARQQRGGGLGGAVHVVHSDPGKQLSLALVGG